MEVRCEREREGGINMVCGKERPRFHEVKQTSKCHLIADFFFDVVSFGLIHSEIHL